MIKCPDFSRLTQSSKDRLAKAGVFELEDTPWGWGKWTVHLQYHWTQTFPAHSTVQIRHEYVPISGDAYTMGDWAVKNLMEAGEAPADEANPKPLNPEDRGDLTSFCLGPALARNMAGGFPKQSAYVATDANSGPTLWMQWVDFILTTANTWKRPIEDFTLIVERSKPEHDGRTLISFCSPEAGKVEKIDADHFQVHLTNFVPRSELHIGFFEVPSAKSSPKK